MGLAGQGCAQIRAGRGDAMSAVSQHGYAMAALLVGLSVMAVLMGMALPVWSQMAKREKEAELIWRGKQYAQAIGLFQRKYANAFPPSLDVLVDQKFLRKKYKDPITNDDFQLIPAGANPTMPGQIPGQPGGARGQSASPFSTGRGGPAASTSPVAAPNPSFQPAGGSTSTPGGTVGGLGIAGVVSKSKEASIKIYNGRQKYNEWTFVYLQTAQGITPGLGAMPTNAPPGGRGGFPGLTPNGPPMMGPGGTTFTPVGPGGRGGAQPFGRGTSTLPPPPFGQGGFGGPQSPFTPFGGRGQQPVGPSRPPGS